MLGVLKISEWTGVKKVLSNITGSRDEHDLDLQNEIVIFKIKIMI